MIAQQCDSSGPTRSQFQNGIRVQNTYWGRDQGKVGVAAATGLGAGLTPVGEEQEGGRVRS